jgi:hypothetical protein
MTLPRSAAEVLSEHVIFAVECIAACLNLYQPWLQHELGVIGYLVELRGLEPLASCMPCKSNDLPARASVASTCDASAPKCP